MSRWRPTPEEERWLAVAARLRGSLAPDALGPRSGGWRSTGPFARIALFVLGCLAAGLVFGVLGIGNEDMLLVAGAIAASAAEWLKIGRRMHASGVEEGLCVGGYLMIGLWIALQTIPAHGGLGIQTFWMIVIAAAGAAGFRLLNPLLTTSAVLAFLGWVDSTRVARPIDAQVAAGFTSLVLACLIAAAALAAGARKFRRPSHDRMLDWLVVALPVFVSARQASWGWFAATARLPLAATDQLVTCVLLTALGVAMLVVGPRRRRHAPLLGFLGCVAGLAVELRIAIGGPAEAWLVIYGTAAIGAGLALDRYLRQPHGGITSTRLTDREGSLDLLQTAGAAVLVQSSRPEAPPPTVGHEGRFGGGGASGSF